MSISTSAVGTNAAASTTSSNKQKELDKDAFLKLLVTQLQNQDPMQPMEDKEFISQLAQFSSLEQMQQVNTNLTSLAASQETLALLLQGQSSYSALNLIGKTIKWMDHESSLTKTGNVDSISFSGGVPVLNVGKEQIQITDIMTVS